MQLFDYFHYVNFFFFIFCLPSLVDPACFPPACLLLSIFDICLLFKALLLPSALASESYHNVCLHVTPALPIAFLKKSKKKTSQLPS